ncbi:hypothetical protein [Thalassospira alkalitolerans]|uniref:hypothetical protein n=1 Tax=Thalassospira alkalitolerans TaxID=1293890 RepID=UPI0030ED3B0B|tara:strand:+ start:105 stop:566 length:462 start_codon:yes stop_codon:yes gene_type:complete
MFWLFGFLFALYGLVFVIKPRKSIGRRGGAILLTVGVISLIGAGIYEDANTSESDVARAKEEREEEVRKGFHCLSSWDGSYPALERFVEERLGDPDSYEHIKTFVSPVSDIGTHNVAMQFRARNGFGGMTIGNASAVISQDGCKIVTASIDGN